MDIKTKFNIGDKAWRMHDNRIDQVEIVFLNVHVTRPRIGQSDEIKTDVEYAVDSPSENGYPRVEEKDLFTSKAELLATL